jgi:FkbM family methyltransferase
MKRLAKKTVNTVLGWAGVRLVHREWGPLGFAAHLERLPETTKNEIATVFDIGASDGKWTRECMVVLPKANFVMIDPLEENQQALKRLCDLNPNCHHWVGALGRGKGELAIHVHGDQSSAYFSREYGGRVRNVRMTSLDDLITESSWAAQPDMIKLDVQGHELDVLIGARKALKEAKLVLAEVSFQRIYESQPLAEEVICFMRDQGFRVLDICTYAQRPLDGILCQAELLFASETTRSFDCTGWSEKR